MKTTQELYGIDPAKLRNMRYEDTLIYKISGAKEMMHKYKLESEKHKYFGKEYNEWLAKYFNSKKARNHTVELLVELPKEEKTTTKKIKL